MAVTAAMIKELRETTGAGMMDCKKALTESDSDMAKAIEFLREKGLATAQKKASRIAAEGVVMMKVSDDKKSAVAVEVNIETDFAAKTDKFTDFVSKVCEQAMATTAKSTEDFLAEPWSLDGSMTVEDARAAAIADIGENIQIRRFAQVKESAGFIASYSHAGGKIGVLLDVATDVINDDIAEMGKNICMQVAALRPQYTSRDEVDQEFIENEKKILLAQIMNDPKESQKPEKVINGIIQGRISKEMKEICLMDQVYVKAEDGKQSVSAYIKEVAKANGANISIIGFVRFETGEGIEKKEENFAEEVAKQIKG